RGRRRRRRRRAAQHLRTCRWPRTRREPYRRRIGPVTGTGMTPLGCRVLGHRPAFRADGRTMRWECERGCGTGGEKTYDTAMEAERFAAAFDRRDDARLGRNAPLLGMFPLRIWQWLRRPR